MGNVLIESLNTYRYSNVQMGHNQVLYTGASEIHHALRMTVLSAE